MENMQEILRVKQITVDSGSMPVSYVGSPFPIVNWLQSEIGDETQEVLILLCLNTKSLVTHYSVVHRGTINQSIAHPRDIFQRALLSNASRIMIAHNHPSGDCSPSRNDDLFTERLSDCGSMMGIPLLDHIIIGENDYYSYRAHNKIKGD